MTLNNEQWVCFLIDIQKCAATYRVYLHEITKFHDRLLLEYSLGSFCGDVNAFFLDPKDATSQQN